MIGLWLLKQHVDGVDDKMAAMRSLLTGGAPEPPPAPPADTPPVPPVVSPPDTTPGDITVPEGTPPAVLVDAVKRYFPQSQWRNALRVSYHESTGWNPRAELNTLNIGPCGTRYYLPSIGGYAQTEDSVGYFQINICAHGGTREFWYDADNNVSKAAQLYAASGWQPWTITAGRLGLL